MRNFQFRSLGRGNVDFEAILRELNAIGYVGPLSVEWEDSGMHQLVGPREARLALLKLDLLPADQRFDGQFDKENQATAGTESKVAVSLRQFAEMLADQELPVSKQKIRFEQLRFVGDPAIDAEVVGEIYAAPSDREHDDVVKPAIAAFDLACPNFVVPIAVA